LLLAVAPSIFRQPGFALKGGTAINLFVQDMSRLSVDLDLVYTDHQKPRNLALAEISTALRDFESELKQLGFDCHTGSMSEGSEVKLFVRRDQTRVKIEINPVFRGTILPIESRALTPKAQDLFFTDIEIPVLHRDELYGSKLVAAMDRQHPRDLFDVWNLYQQTGLTPDIVECFVCYLAGHHRPIHEVLFANEINFLPAFTNEFSGMTRDPVELSTLTEIRRRLFADLPASMTDKHRKFLIGLAGGEPDWTLMACPHLSELPAIRWKMGNLSHLRKANPAKFARQQSELRLRLGA
jgi:hypothetical protein